MKNIRICAHIAAILAHTVRIRKVWIVHAAQMAFAAPYAGACPPGRKADPAMAISDWDEIRTAYYVARHGTVSGAAQALGVHHATVIRHIDALEGRLGSKLFQRHARGYTPTEAGADLLQVAQVTEDQFSQLAGRIRGGGADVSGELAVTSLVQLSPLIVPVLARFQMAHPDVNIRLLTGERLFRLEYGEAHVAIRAGSAPDDPDNVVQPFFRAPMALYGSADYVARHGRPESDADLRGHRFAGYSAETSPAPFEQWLRKAVPPEAVVFRGADTRVLIDAVRAGVGLGFLTRWEAADANLVEVMAPRDEWAVAMWLVSHVDLHRTPKVQAILAELKQAVHDWPADWVA